jgi:hypothetical protein
MLLSRCSRYRKMIFPKKKVFLAGEQKSQLKAAKKPPLPNLVLPPQTLLHLQTFYFFN